MKVSSSFQSPTNPNFPAIPSKPQSQTNRLGLIKLIQYKIALILDYEVFKWCLFIFLSFSVIADHVSTILSIIEYFGNNQLSFGILTLIFYIINFIVRLIINYFTFDAMFEVDFAEGIQIGNNFHRKALIYIQNFRKLTKLFFQIIYFGFIPLLTLDLIWVQLVKVMQGTNRMMKWYNLLVILCLATDSLPNILITLYSQSLDGQVTTILMVSTITSLFTLSRNFNDILVNPFILRKIDDDSTREDDYETGFQLFDNLFELFDTFAELVGRICILVAFAFLTRPNGAWIFFAIIAILYIIQQIWQKYKTDERNWMDFIVNIIPGVLFATIHAKAYRFCHYGINYNPQIEGNKIFSNCHIPFLDPLNYLFWRSFQILTISGPVIYSALNSDQLNSFSWILFWIGVGGLSWSLLNYIIDSIILVKATQNVRKFIFENKLQRFEQFYDEVFRFTRLYNVSKHVNQLLWDLQEISSRVNDGVVLQETSYSEFLKIIENQGELEKNVDKERWAKECIFYALDKYLKLKPLRCSLHFSSFDKYGDDFIEKMTIKLAEQSQIQELSISIKNFKSMQAQTFTRFFADGVKYLSSLQSLSLNFEGVEDNFIDGLQSLQGSFQFLKKLTLNFQNQDRRAAQSLLYLIPEYPIEELNLDLSSSSSIINVLDEEYVSNLGKKLKPGLKKLRVNLSRVQLSDQIVKLLAESLIANQRGSLELINLDLTLSMMSNKVIGLIASSGFYSVSETLKELSLQASVQGYLHGFKTPLFTLTKTAEKDPEQIVESDWKILIKSISKNLTKLDLQIDSGRDFVEDAHILFEELGNLNQIIQLRLSLRADMSQEGMPTNFAKGISRLKETLKDLSLEFVDIPIPSNSFCIIGRGLQDVAGSLREFKINLGSNLLGCDIDNDVLGYLKNVAKKFTKNLQVLEIWLNGCSRVEDIGIKNLIKEGLEHLQLREFVLSVLKCFKLTNSIVLPLMNNIILKQAQSLEKMEINLGGTRVTSWGYNVLDTGRQWIKHFEVN